MTIRYRRTMFGAVIHRAECYYAANGMTWSYGDDLDGEAIALAALAYNLKLCRRCRPQDVGPEEVQP
jgi:hypothetical protein